MSKASHLAIALATITFAVQGCTAASQSSQRTPSSTTINRTTRKNIDQKEWYEKYGVPGPQVNSESTYPTTQARDTLTSSSPWFAYGGYLDEFDQDCEDIGRLVYVGNYDPDELDADGDGWGCEGWWGGMYLGYDSGGSSYDYEYDEDCEDVGEEVWVGDYDPDGLDADGDGWGCEGW